MKMYPFLVPISANHLAKSPVGVVVASQSFVSQSVLVGLSRGGRMMNEGEDIVWCLIVTIFAFTRSVCAVVGGAHLI